MAGRIISIIYGMIWGAAGHIFFPVDQSGSSIVPFVLIFFLVIAGFNLIGKTDIFDVIIFSIFSLSPPVVRLFSAGILDLQIASILSLLIVIAIILPKRKRPPGADTEDGFLDESVGTEITAGEYDNRFQAVTENLDVGVAIAEDDRFIYVNKAFADIFGYKKGELIKQMSPMDLVHDDDRLIVEALIRARDYLQDRAQHYEFTGVRKDGTPMYIEIHDSIVNLENRTVYVATLSNITDRKVMEHTLRESEKQFRDMFYKHSAVMLLVDPVTGEIYDFNERASLFYGFSQRSRGTRNLHEISVSVKNDDLQNRDSYPGVVLDRHRVARDEIRYVEIHSAPISVRERSLDFLIIHDVTDRVEYERERGELIRDLEAFAHTVSHNLRNSLNVIIGRASLLKRNPLIVENEKLFKTIRTIERSGMRMDEIMEALLLFATVRHSEVETGDISMDESVHSAMERINDMIQERSAEISIPEMWPGARGYAPWIEEVWFNYLTNALKYGGDPPRITLGAIDDGSGYVLYYVDDNGPGIRTGYLSRLFTPFTRLEEGIRGGHGLGLSIVKRIIEKLQGQVGVESLPEGGTRFYFTLPAASGGSR